MDAPVGDHVAAIRSLRFCRRGWTFGGWHSLHNGLRVPVCWFGEEFPELAAKDLPPFASYMLERNESTSARTRERQRGVPALRLYTLTSRVLLSVAVAGTALLLAFVVYTGRQDLVPEVLGGGFLVLVVALLVKGLGSFLRARHRAPETPQELFSLLHARRSPELALLPLDARDLYIAQLLLELKAQVRYPVTRPLVVLLFFLVGWVYIYLNARFGIGPSYAPERHAALMFLVAALDLSLEFRRGAFFFTAIVLPGFVELLEMNADALRLARATRIMKPHSARLRWRLFFRLRSRLRRWLGQFRRFRYIWASLSIGMPATLAIFATTAAAMAMVFLQPHWLLPTGAAVATFLVARSPLPSWNQRPVRYRLRQHLHRLEELHRAARRQGWDDPLDASSRSSAR